MCLAENPGLLRDIEETVVLAYRTEYNLEMDSFVGISCTLVAGFREHGRSPAPQ